MFVALITNRFRFFLSWQWHQLGIIRAKAKFIKALIFDRIGEVWGWDDEASLIKSGAPNENKVQNHLNIALLNVF